jgi:hypothetical protein
VTQIDLEITPPIRGIEISPDSIKDPAAQIPSNTTLSGSENEISVACVEGEGENLSLDTQENEQGPPSRPSPRTPKAPIWNGILEEKNEDGPTFATEVEKMKSGADIERWNGWFGLDVPAKAQKIDQHSKEVGWVQRIKRYLPSLAAVRSVAMPITALDPHKVAPIICASVLFAAEVCIHFASVATLGSR